MSLLDYVENGPSSGYAMVASGFQTSLQAFPSPNMAFSKVIKGPNGITEDPIFSLDKIQFTFPGEIVNLTVSNNILYCALEPTKSNTKDGGRLQKLFRIDLDREDGEEELTFAAKTRDDRIYGLFLSPSGTHLLISFHSGDNYYLHTTWKQPKLLTRIKAVRIQSVTWSDDDPARDTTGPILFGSNQGHLYETEISAVEGMTRKPEKYFVQHLSIPGGSPITGLEYVSVPDSPGSYVVYMSTPSQLYHLVGRRRFEEDGSSFGEISVSFGNNSEFQEIPGKPRSSKLLIMPAYKEMDGDAHVCWTTGTCILLLEDYITVDDTLLAPLEPGLYQGMIQLANATVGESTLTNAILLPYPDATHFPNEPHTMKTPLSVAMTRFHYLLLFSHYLAIINSIDGSIYSVHQISLLENEKLLGLSTDRAKNTFWLHSNLSLYEIIVEEEDRDIWKIFASKKDFSSASQFVKNTTQRDTVEREWAEWLFSRGQFDSAASHFAGSSLPLEEIALRFLNLSETNALKSFLSGRLRQYKKTDVTQVTVLGLWILDLIAGKVDEMEATESRIRVSIEDTQDETQKQRLKKDLDQHIPQLEKARKELHQFLIEHKETLHRKTVYEVLESHGRHKDIHKFAETVGDWDPVIRGYLDTSQWEKAIDVLSRQSSVELYYTYSPDLIVNVPKETIQLWIKTPLLNPRKLMPSMLACERSVPEGDVHLTRYLQHVLRTTGSVQDRVLENFLVRLLVKSASPEDEAHLLAYINSQKDNPFFDLRYTLRQCQSKHLVQSSVQIYSFLGLHEEAVSLALKHGDLDLARLVADRLEGNEEARKQLWLNIARHVIEKESDLKRGLQIMAEGNLKMEHILPFFPDFVYIDAFKEELCAILRQYNEHIDTLKVELEDSIKNSEMIRAETHNLQNRYAVVPVTQNCSICKTPLFTRQFYVFPCEHVYHFDCLVQENIKWSVRGRRIKELRNLLSSASSGDSSGLSKKNVSEAQKQKWKIELDDLVGSECALCGEMMIRTLDRPFVQEGDAF